MTALDGLRVVELSSERGALAGKLLADMGAEVVVVEPPGGDRMRSYEPFFQDEPDPECSLYWWHYNTSKLGVTLDLDAEEDRGRLQQLVETADVLIECEEPGRLASLGLDYPSFREGAPRLVYVSITPFGQSGPGVNDAATDLTVLAGGGPAWNCGYDDHSIPPVRGGGNQGYQTGSHFAVMSALVALLAREQTGRGQHIDVSMHAAANVTTEAGSYEWLVAQTTVRRLTGRHASQYVTMPSQILCADGRYVNTGVPPTRPDDFRRLHEWLTELGLVDRLPEAVFLEEGAAREKRIELSRIADDPEVRAIFGAGREAMNLIAGKLSAYDFFVGAQERGMPVGIIYSPDEVMDDPHFVERGFPVPVEHPELGETFTYPGAPYVFHGTPWKLSRRAPKLGEHNEQVLGPLEELERKGS
jgi:crotonobetainyl-CoA:carnitine CoA-transferase CaiB-like acyl-CoA transferase